MEGGGLEHMVISVAACAVAVLVGLSAFAVSGRSEHASPMFLLATPPGGTYFDFVVSILMENHGICDILTYCGGSAPFETQLANASGLATNYSPSPCGKSLLDYLCLTPNVCNDMDICPVAAGDAYLSTLVPKILGSTVFTTERAALFITFDEAANGRGTPAIYTVWSGPAAKLGYTSSVSYNHFSHLSTVEANWNLPPLNANDSAARNMSEFFVGSPPDFSLSASPWTLSFMAGRSAISNVSLQSQNGFQGAVTLDATSSPAGVTAVCSPSVISGGETSACSMTSSAAGSFDGTVPRTAGATVNHVTIHVQVIGVLSAGITPPSSSFADEPVTFVGSASGGL